MTTIYEETPTLRERVLASDVIAIGRAGGLVSIEPMRLEEQQRVFGLFEVDFDEVLQGQPESAHALLRVVGEGSDENATWLIPVGQPNPLLLFLVRDRGAGLPENLYAPYFAGGYDVAAGGIAKVPSGLVDDWARKATGFTRTGLPLKGLRRLIALVAREREETERRGRELEPQDFHERPYPQLLEAPRAPVGGGEPAGPEQVAEGPAKRQPRRSPKSPSSPVSGARRGRKQPHS